jgi:serine/threonine-protein kinase HipA
MTVAAAKSIYVYADWPELKTPAFVGTLHVTPGRGEKENFSFEYEKTWMKTAHAVSLGPSLQASLGRQFPPMEKDTFEIFLDSAPDRWGRTLMQRREAQKAREEGRRARALLESDFLLGVFDGHRMGALRFKLDPAGPFLDNNIDAASPPWTALRDLEHAAKVLEETKEDSPKITKALRLLIAPGSSLGGARPKSSVVDEKGELWIAKFPSTKDRIDVGAWELVVHELASEAGIDVAPARVQKFSGDYHTFLTKRFDRTSAQERLHFASAMTLLQRSDGDDASAGASYLELANLLVAHGSQTNEDLAQLWRRILFSVCVSNTDDHLRNHGFLLDKKGWRLAPAYDMNPVATGNGLSLNISETDNSQNLDLLREVAPIFRIKKVSEANAAISEVTKVAGTWRKKASKHKIPRAEQEQMANAFRLAKAK